MNFCPEKRVGINFETLKNELNINFLEFNVCVFVLTSTVFPCL